jgi:hypothetical protein
MRSLVAGFELLYGVPAAGGHCDVGTTKKGPVKEANSPFIRFAHAFFREVGCPYQKNSIQKALLQRTPR